MAYEPTNWKTGEVITAEKLNHMEDGIASGGISVITITLTDAEGGTLNASSETSYADALSAMRNGVVVFKVVYMTMTQDVFGQYDYDPEEPDYSSISIYAKNGFDATIIWNRSDILVSTDGGAD